MKKIKKYIIFLLIISIILIVSIILLVNQINLNEVENPNQEQIKELPVRIMSNEKFYIFDERIKFYLTEVEIGDKKVLDALLNEEYKQKNLIKEENVMDIIPTYKDYNSYRTLEMYELNEQYYFIKGMIDNKNVFFAIGHDNENKTFDVNILTQEEFEKILQGNVENDIKQKIIIENKTYNIMVDRNIDESIIAKFYYDEYLKLILEDAETAYQILDDNYRETRFKTLDDFKKFVENNREKLELTYKIETIDENDFQDFQEYYNFKKQYENLKINNYYVQKYEEYSQYVCKDIYENYYIFNVSYPGEYKVIYDMHSIEIPEFTKKYYSSDTQVKVGMNIEKFFDAINTKDYSYAYNVLAESFKVNFYKNQYEFENYIKSSLFEYNKISYDKYIEEGNTYVYEITVIDRKNEKNTKKMTIIMQLGENTDFRMSFNIQ